MRQTVGALLGEFLEQQRAVIVEVDSGVHKTRVAIRRYRSVLRVFASVFDGERTRILDTELRWYSGVLGAVRDLEVLAEGVRFDGLPASTPGLVDARQAVTQRVRDDLRQARAELRRVRRLRRYRVLLDDLQSWHDATPLGSPADDDAWAVRGYLRHAKKVLKKRINRATDDVSLHRARKAAKRARYAAELAEPVLGAKAARLASRAKDLQTRLGAHQDSVFASAYLLGVAADAPSEAQFALGMLYQREQQQAAATV